MNYLNYIFENQDIKTYVAYAEPYINEGSNYIIQFNIDLYDHIVENIGSFIAEDASSFYSNIRDFVIQENLEFYNILIEGDEEESKTKKVAKGVAKGAAGLLAAHLAAKYGLLGKAAQRWDFKNVALPSAVLKSAYFTGQGLYDVGTKGEGSYPGRIGAGLKAVGKVIKGVKEAND